MRAALKEALGGHDPRAAVGALWNAAAESGAGVALWRAPRSEELHFLADFAGRPRAAVLDIAGGQEGFAVAPFDNPGGRRTRLLRPGLHVVFSPAGARVRKDDAPEDFPSRLAERLKRPGPPFLHAASPPDTRLSDNRAHYLGCVRAALSAIEAGELEKVIVARTRTLPRPAAFNPVRRLLELAAAGTEAFLSLISLPGAGTWAGASPELLVELTAAGVFRTVSLAATQMWPQSERRMDAAWTQKEIEEQAMVNRYIIEQFKTLRLREFVETGPRSVRAGALLHLKTEYHVDLNETPFPRLADRMLALLHPTSAVCGMPKAGAQRFIAAREALDRALYGGYLGPVNIGGETRLYVNLRCVQILPSSVVVYAGAGITHDSDPEKEWDETELKCDAVQDLFHVPQPGQGKHPPRL